MKTKLLALIALAGGSLLAQPRVSIGIGVGSGPAYYGPARVVAAPAFRPGYVWVEGYWTRTRFGRTFVPGYWMRRPLSNNYRNAPRFDQRYDNAYRNR